MNDKFDPYHIWLGIPPAEQPPNHYRLLGIQVGESNIEVIERAADGKALQLKTTQVGKHSALSQRLLNEVAAAKVCLLNPAKRSTYDAVLAKELAPKAHSALAPVMGAGDTPQFAVSSTIPSRTRLDSYGKKKSAIPFFDGAKIILGAVAGLFLAVLILSYFAGIDPLGWGKNSRKAADNRVAITPNITQSSPMSSVPLKQGRVGPTENKNTAGDMARSTTSVPSNDSTPTTERHPSSADTTPTPAIPIKPVDSVSTKAAIKELEAAPKSTSKVELEGVGNSTNSGTGFPVGKWSLEYNNELRATTVIQSDGAVDFLNSLGHKELGSIRADGKMFVIQYATFVEVWIPRLEGTRFDIKHYSSKASYPDQEPSHSAFATKFTVGNAELNRLRWLDSKDNKHFYERVSEGQWRERVGELLIVRQTVSSADFVELEHIGSPLWRVRLYADHVDFSEAPFQNYRRVYEGAWAPSITSEIENASAGLVKLKNDLAEVDKHLASAKASLLQQFDQAQAKTRSSKVIKDGDRLAMLTRIKQERAAFENFGYLPFCEPMRGAMASYSTKWTKAEQLARAAYDRQIAICFKANQDELAALLVHEKERRMTPRIVARWRLINVSLEWTAFSDSTAIASNGSTAAPLEFNGNTFVLHWTTPSGEKVVDKCILNALGTGFGGKNSFDFEFTGESIGPDR